ncbi:hypothetical protein V9T40_000088 [Parthenolecanium corni]|uniref:PLC-beta PH domain-containing protein n=1 Tax=Parthenolecanium corni TaxID=536013 RepID=A0AAN9TDZ7_9HEMI
MTKKFEFNWQIPVPEPLLNGCVFDRWTEEKDSSDNEQNCMFKVDEYGFFIYWKSEQRDGDAIELCQVSDIRAGGVPKVSLKSILQLDRQNCPPAESAYEPWQVDSRLMTTLSNKHGDNLDEKSLTICSGTDYININYQHIICPDPDTAKVRIVLHFLLNSGNRLV